MQTSPASSGSGGWLGPLLGLLVGFGAGVAAVEWHYWGGASGGQSEVVDANDDGIVDGWYWYVDGLLQRSESDRDFDGKTDAWRFYDHRGVLARWEADDDLDGTPDVEQLYADGRAFLGRYDADHDGRWDRFCELRNELYARCFWDPGESGQVERVDEYVDGWRRETLFVNPQSGLTDRRRLYDRVGRVVGDEPVDPRPPPERPAFP